MEPVWFLFKVVEGILGAICLVSHIISLHDELEPMPHVVFYCGTFFGFTLLSVVSGTAILMKRKVKCAIDVFVTSLGAISYITAAILSMYHAEIDFHLMYLSDFEEPLHPFFRNCKRQSISALACGFVYLLNCVFVIDVIMITKKTADDSENAEAKEPIKLYFVCESLHRKLLEYKWFQEYCDDFTIITQPSAIRREMASISTKARLRKTQSTFRMPQRHTVDYLYRGRGGGNEADPEPADAIQTHEDSLAV